MTTRLSLGCAVILLALAAPSPVWAADQQYDADCKPVPQGEERWDLEYAQTWPPIGWGITLAYKFCKGKNFLTNLLKRQPDPDKVNGDDIVEALKPEGASAQSADPRFRAALAGKKLTDIKPNWNAQPKGEMIAIPPATPDGEVSYFQSNGPASAPPPTSLETVQGDGVLLTAGGAKRGTFASGKLNGPGEEIGPDGVWRSGAYERGMMKGTVTEVRTIDGKTYLAEGPARDGKLDGMVERIYADGSHQFEEWGDGRLLQVGVRVPKGQTALAPQSKYRGEVEVVAAVATPNSSPGPRRGGPFPCQAEWQRILAEFPTTDSDGGMRRLLNNGTRDRRGRSLMLVPMYWFFEGTWGPMAFSIGRFLARNNLPYATRPNQTRKVWYQSGVADPADAGSGFSDAFFAYSADIVALQDFLTEFQRPGNAGSPSGEYVACLYRARLDEVRRGEL